MASDSSSKKLRKPPRFWSQAPGPNSQFKSALTYINMPKSPVSPPRLPKRRRSRYVPRPEPGSLNARIQSRPELSLFTKPISWTDLHTSMLNVKFREVVDNDTLPMVSSEFTKATTMNGQAMDTMESELKGLWNGSKPFFNKSPINTALQCMFGGPFQDSVDSQDMHLWFGGKMYRNMAHVPVVWNWPAESQASFHSEATNPADSFVVSTSIPSSPVPTIPDTDQPAMPMMAHLHRKTLRTMRKAPFRIVIGPENVKNEPVINLARLRGKLFSPSNWDEDAYLVPIFISMAQKYFYVTRQRKHFASPTPSPPGDPTMPDFHDIKLRVLTDDRHPEQFVIYTATVTAAFLKQFHNPYKTFNEPSGEPAGMEITYTKVPYEQVETFRHRVGTALGEDIVGRLLVAIPRVPPKAPSPGLKRKRMADDEAVGEQTEGQQVTNAPQSPKRHCAQSRERLNSPNAFSKLTPPENESSAQEQESEKPCLLKTGTDIDAATRSRDRTPTPAPVSS